jgi:hypothetical protein
MRHSTIIRIAIGFLTVVLLLGVFAYGVVAQRYGIFPYAYIDDVEAAVEWFLDRSPGNAPWYYVKTTRTAAVTDKRKNRTHELNLVTSIGPNHKIEVRVVNMAGDTVHSWDIDWFDIWPDPQHVRPGDRPQSAPGGHVHGIVMLDDGSIVFNFEKLAMVRMGLCGEIIWKLPYRTHHSVFEAEDGNLWTAGMKVHETALDKYPMHVAPVRETSVLKISPDGEILREISVFDLLANNELRPWLHMGADKKSNAVSGDALHLNDVELFPSDMQSDIFSPGDIMLSLRNINSILVFDRKTLQIKYWRTGGFVRQHDPDFVADGKITVFDNNFIGPPGYGQNSRIIAIDPVTDSAETVFTGTSSEPFYTKIMGKHQWLPDGSLLLTDSINGRAIQVNKDGDTVWEFVNLVDEGVVGIVEEVQRLEPRFAKLIDGYQCDANYGNTT